MVAGIAPGSGAICASTVPLPKKQIESDAATSSANLEKLDCLIELLLIFVFTVLGLLSFETLSPDVLNMAKVD